jgi:DNA-directed RNA polymerase subunit RPC12/RpoP
MQLQATADINTDEYIGTYGGKLLFVDADGESDWSPYQMAPDSTATYYIDALEIGNEMRYINDCKGVGSKTPNVGFFQSRRKFKGYYMTEVYAIKPIKAGEEILVSYGEEYWGLLKKWYDEKHLFACPNCEFRTGKKAIFDQHIRNEATPIDSHECLYCGKEFKTLNNLNAHLNTHTAEKLYQCDECEYFSFWSDSLRRHIAYKHSSELQFKCFDCDKGYKSKTALDAHIVFQHRDDKPFHCPKCDYKGKLQHSLTRHTRRAHEGNANKKNICSYEGCEYRSVTRSDLKRHVEAIHEKKKNFKCPHCSKEFYAMNTFTYHIEHVHQDSDN